MSERLMSTYRKLSYTPPAIQLMLRLADEKIHFRSEYPIPTDLVRKNGFAKQFVALSKEEKKE